MQPALVTTGAASLMSRAIAIIIDAVILSVLAGILVAALDTTGSLLTAIIGFGYWIVLEKQQGATVGKMVMGLKVTMEDGSPLTWGAAIVRNVLRIIDGLFLYLVGALIASQSPQKQRLGDKVAHTVVWGKGATITTKF